MAQGAREPIIIPDSAGVATVAASITVGVLLPLQFGYGLPLWATLARCVSDWLDA